MSKKFEVAWQMFGTASVEASSQEEAETIAQNELIAWSGFGLDEVEGVMVDGVDIP